MTLSSIDAQIVKVAATAGCSPSKLRAVYLRGVAEFTSSDQAVGSAVMYGLARVQRFVTNRVDAIDEDLRVTEPTATPAEIGASIELDSSFYELDAIYASGANIARLFAPAQVTSIEVGDSQIAVGGTLGATPWKFELNTATREHYLRIE